MSILATRLYISLQIYELFPNLPNFLAYFFCRIIKKSRRLVAGVIPCYF